MSSPAYLWGWDVTNSVWVKVQVNSEGKLIIDGGYTQGARVSRSTDQSIPNDTLTALIFDTEDWDTDSCWNVANPDRLTCKTAGKYLVSAWIYWGVGTTGVREVGFTTSGVTVGLGYNSANAPPAGLKRSQSCSIILDLAVNDYVECAVWHTQGTALDCESPGWAPSFAIQRIG